VSSQLIEVQPLTGALGAELHGIDLAQPLGNQAYQEIHDALMEHQVVFFRDQDITPEQHIAFAGSFGELHVHPYAPQLEGYPEILVLNNDAERPPRVNAWHTDVTFEERPPMGSILHGKVIPEHGGDTVWANTYMAYEALSDQLQHFLDGLTAVHDYARAFFGLGVPEREVDWDKLAQARKTRPPREHPVVRTHPVTGRKSLFVNSVFTSHIKGLKQKESEAILRMLYEHMQSPDFQCRFRWRENSIAFWDNRCTQHFAVADYYPEARRMHRVTVIGERPV